ncbi:MAG: squalene synthase HpnC [Rhodocyclaceae bacterium]|jgi:phytoene synthase|nr:squalene synthase HpnC [Rhodocyclaceae bacterium]MCL4682571.1 squalene synthase HpnC [Rhodocyclaceae bacterium]
MSVDHYENFPVASVLLPARLREPVRAIYAFARSADDIADEGTLGAAERLAALAHYRSELDAIEAGRPTEDPIFLRLRPVIAEHKLPLQLFRDLLDAFAQDVTQQRYANFAELMDYCRRSADPVGRLLLRLFGSDDAKSQSLSDGICSSLQLINHWQDIAIDWRKGRIYLPQDELARFGIAESQIAEGRWDAAWAALMDFQIDRARRMMLDGSPLVHQLPGRIGLELRLIVASGLRMLDKLQRARGDVFRRRPVISGRDWPAILLHALFG